MDSGVSHHDGFREDRARTSRSNKPARNEQLPMARSRQSKNERRRRFEQFEERLVMSAQALMPTVDVAQLVEEIAPLVEDSALISSAETSSETVADHGFDGSGQTIAIIDSGIAWDHAALGNGYGSGNKVVGGWDFAENDSNPYDDGPAGFHGTHVAGIAAGDGESFQGVAPGADLVGLRVFNDQGVGKIEWVESALQWVRNNLDSFANPITTVNMSLGADWNTESVSDWNVIEDELADLKSEGVFISVAAGNDFEDFASKT
jgi:subtilisin family serine protease